jgi:putative FmdB family regulatory protein
MPMYEFFCANCNTIFTFLSKSVNTDRIPSCPKCKLSSLSRMISRFAVTGKAKEPAAGEGQGDGPDLPIDEARMERAMETLAADAGNIDENNPRQAAELMRKFSNLTGLKLGDKMEDALSRLEAGEDPEALEAAMGDLDENDLFKLDGAAEASKIKAAGKRKAPLRDETLYEL